jgi:DNA-binding transcriptional LysR family regulator
MVVHDRGSFNKAAAELYMVQSAVSQHIQSLEAALGVSLFERSPRGVRPTEAGERLYDYARQMFQLLADAEREIMQINRAQKHQLTVAATPGVSVYLLPKWLQHFQQVHPNISVSLQTALTHEVVNDVLNGQYDLGFLEGELAELDQQHLGKTRLRDVEYFITVSAGHEWAQQKTISVHDLPRQPLINRLPTSRARRWLETVSAGYAVSLNSIAELDSPGAIKYALLNQMGIAILPDYAVEREAERGEIILLRLAELVLIRPLLLIWDRRRAFTPIQRAFLSVLANEGELLPLWALFQSAEGDINT